MNALLTFNATASADPDGDKLTYIWDFGDGAQARFSFPMATHRYAQAGLYTVRLTVEDGRGGSDTTTATVAVQRRAVVYHRVDRYRIQEGLVNPEAFRDLDAVVREMRYDLSLRAHIVAHTDATGSDAYNLRLSQRRAEAVRDYLTSQGISPNRITLEWKGKAEPVAPNTTREGRARNRRTEILVRPITSGAPSG
ncbi:MAG: hypothetical protein KatS3mg131_1472 [Candidatus Tectimicrobiota bacterium]|nr:MAG: hypothetical protein KatS3mg131_1472 [Candidatus Tectomicrobia bacterium]